MSRLALLIPARNATSVLGRLLDSADAQTVPFDEIRLYDDASTDRTGDMAASRGAIVLRSEVNTGPSIGKNRLAALTTCEWLHFHDADDELKRDFVERAHEWMQLAQDVVLFPVDDRDDDTGAFLGRADWDDAALQRDAVCYTIQTNVTNCGIYRRDRFLSAGGFDSNEATKYNEDQAMHMRLALQGLRFRAETTSGIIVYRRRSSMSADHQVDCARAQYVVLEGAAAKTGETYAKEIGARLWKLAAVCGGFSDWTYVRKCLALARSLGYTDPLDEHWAMRLAARVSPVGAVKARERLIRFAKPALRANMPSAKTLTVSR